MASEDAPQRSSTQAFQPTHRTRVSCPHCSSAIDVDDEHLQAVTCPACGSTFPADQVLPTRSWTPVTLPPLGKFTLLEKLGEGHFGTVYRAWDTVLKRMVAVKVPRRENYTRPQDEERFEREARAAAALDHPGIVRVLDFGSDADTPFIVSDFVRGVTLRDALTGRRFTFRETAQIVAEVAEALDHAHQNKVIHRDIKPSNIMLAVDKSTSSGLRPRVMDFGLARQEEGDVTLTREGQVLGTYAYMSPEQARGESHQADGRSDVFSLGVVLYELLVGDRPFRGNLRMLQHQIIYEEPRSPRRLNDQIPRDLETIALKCLAKEAERRYQTAGAVAADLRHWLAGEPIQARPVRAPERLWLWCRRRPAIASLAAALLLACVLGAAGVAWQWGRAERHRREATAYFQEARREVDTFLSGTSDVLQYYPGVLHARERLLERAAEEYARFAERQSDAPELQLEFGRAFVRLGDVRLDLKQPDRAAEAYRSAQSAFDQLAQQYPRAAEYVLERANSRTKLGIALQELGLGEEAKQEYLGAIDELRPLVEAKAHVAEYRDALGTARLNLGRLLHALGRHDDAEQHVQAAIGDFRLLVETPAAQDAAPEADRRYRFALARARNTGGLILSSRGRNAEAATVFQEGIRDFESLGRADAAHPHYVQARADSRTNLANAWRSVGREEEAKTTYEAALADYQELLDALPDVPAFRADVAQAQLNLGAMLHDLGLNPEAKPRLEQATAMWGALVQQHPQAIEYYEKLSLAQVARAQVLRDLGETTPAENELRSAIQTFEVLVTGSPRPAYRELLAVARMQLARVLQQTGRNEDARQEFTTAITGLQTLAKADAGAPQYRDELAWGHSYRGDLLLDMGQTQDAAADYDQVLTLRQQLVKESPDPDYRYRLAWFLANCRDLKRRDPQTAIGLAQQAKKLAPDSAAYGNAVGVAHYRAGDWQKSITALEEAAKRRPNGHCLDWFFLAMAHWQNGNKEKAKTNYDQGIRWLEEHSPAHPEFQRHREEAARCLKPNGPDTSRDSN